MARRNGSQLIDAAPSSGAAADAGSQGNEITQRKARRAATAAASENAIRPSSVRQSYKSAEVQRAEPPASESRKDVRSKGVATPPVEPAVPEEVRARFLRVGRNYFFPDGTRAFTDRGKRLTTPSENTQVIRSLVSIAQARGWAEVTVAGTERFRKEAWSAARTAGLEVRGYRPSDVEEQRLIRALARQSSAKSSEAAPSTRDKSPSERRDRAPRRADLIVGRLVDHGAAPYKQEPGAAGSYFAQIETPQGDRTIWGVDLERALRSSLSQPQPGDEVGLRRVRREAVTVKAPERDAQGNLVGERDKPAQRTQWVVEKREFFAERAAAAKAFGNAELTAQVAIRQHPELLGSYLQLRSAEEVAALRIRDPADQRQFVALVRSALADSIASGAPLLPVRLRERQASQKEPVVRRAPDRAAVPARG
jgi:hypothetical protein